jgi:hypothetical protein
MSSQVRRMPSFIYNHSADGHSFYRPWAGFRKGEVGRNYDGVLMGCWCWWCHSSSQPFAPQKNNSCTHPHVQNKTENKDKEAGSTDAMWDWVGDGQSPLLSNKPPKNGCRKHHNRLQSTRAKSIIHPSMISQLNNIISRNPMR